MKADIPSPEIIIAARDYLFLLNRGYPEKPSLELTGNRYRLDKTDRMVLFRGICPTAKADIRRGKLYGVSEGAGLVIDGYNLFFTILNYRMGKKLFIGYDGFLRDAGGTHGRFGNKKMLEEIMEESILFLKGRNCGSVCFYLDSPVSHSAEHTVLIQKIMETHGLKGSCGLGASADYLIKQALGPVKPPIMNTAKAEIPAHKTLAVSSDTGIIDSIPGGIYDCARDFLETRYKAVFLNLRDILHS